MTESSGGVHIVVNHAGLVAQELALGVEPLGWQVLPLDALSRADLLVAFPYGDPRGTLAAVRRAAELGVPSAFWNVEDPRYFLDPELGPIVRSLARESTVTFSTTTQLAAEYRALGVELEYLPNYGRGWFFVQEPVPEAQRTIDLAFLGSLTPGRRAFLERLRHALGGDVTLVARDDARDPDEARSLVAQARLGLAIGSCTDTETVVGHGVTERAFDYPLAGTAVLSDYGPLLRGLFAVDEETFVFRDVDDAAARARALLGDPLRRFEAMQRARRRVLAAHLGQHRLLRIVDTLALRCDAAKLQRAAAEARRRLGAAPLDVDAHARPFPPAGAHARPYPARRGSMDREDEWLDLEAFARGIEFDRHPPKDPALELVGQHLHETRADVQQTRLPRRDAALRELLAGPVGIPRMATFAIGALLNEAVRAMPDGEAFVNIGVWHGFTLLAGMAGNGAKRCVGVDDFSEFGGPRAEFLARFETVRSAQHEFHDMEYRRYFAEAHRGPIGLYLYDGSHDHASQLEGLRVAEPFFAPGCVVIVDDTNLASARQATFAFIAGSRRRYRVAFDRTTPRNGHPTFWNGLTILVQG